MRREIVKRREGEIIRTKLFLFLIASSLLALPVNASILFQENFSDSDLTNNPTWDIWNGYVDSYLNGRVHPHIGTGLQLHNSVNFVNLSQVIITWDYNGVFLADHQTWFKLTGHKHSGGTWFYVTTDMYNTANLNEIHYEEDGFDTLITESFGDNITHSYKAVYNFTGDNLKVYKDDVFKAECNPCYRWDGTKQDITDIELFFFTSDSFSSWDNIIVYDVLPTETSFDPSGYVKNASGSAIQNATVTLYNSTWSSSAVSNGAGYWNITLPASGTYNYVAAKTGYAPISPQSQSFSSGSPTNFTLSPLSIATNPSIKFDKSSYTVGDTMTITTYAATSGSVQLLDSKGNAKLTVPISAQQTLVSTYHVTQSDIEGIWQANLRDNTNSPIATDNAQVTIPTVPVTNVTTGCNTPACNKGEWTVEDAFVWMRIYIPWFTFLIFGLFIIACIGSLKNMIWRPKKKSNSRWTR